jgi:hypothetical protein
MVGRTLTVDRVPLPPGFRMFILPEYRLVTPSYSVKLSRSRGAIVTALLASYDRYVLRSEIENILWGHLENGGPENATNVISVMLIQIRKRFHAIGIDITFKPNRWAGRGSAITATGLAECAPVGCPDNPTRLRALRDRQSPNPMRGLTGIRKPPEAPPGQKPEPKQRQPLPPKPRHNDVERPRVQASWTHNARAEAYFGKEGPT